MKKLASLLLLLSASSYAQYYPLPQQVQDAADGMINGCEVKLNVDGWANQLYVNGRFSGNFRSGVEDYNLARAIDDQIYYRACNYKSSYEIQIMNDPYLIDDFANYRYQNCFVRLNVDGWANQIYVNNVFSGNFNNRSEDRKLRSALASYVANGTCYRGSSYPSPRPNPYPQPRPNPYPYPRPNPYPQPRPNPYPHP
jgi:hypothetical protein